MNPLQVFGNGVVGNIDPLPECAHEREVLDLVLADRWPERCDADTLAHVAECEICADVVSVALAMREDQALEPIERAPVPDATLVWWRAQLRAHEEAGRKAARPIAMVQGVAIGIAGVAALSLGRTFWPWIKQYATGVAQYATGVAQYATGVAESASGSSTAASNVSLTAASIASSTTAAAAAAPWLTLAVAVSIVATPVAVYFALGRE